MNKRILSLVLALVMVLGTFTSVFAAEANKEAKKPENGEKVEKVVGKDQKIQYVIDRKFVEGYEDGSFGYDKNIKRSEITRLLVLANGYEELAKKLQGSMKIYTDVDTAHWANGVITVGTTKPSDANGIPFLVGYPDGSFLPENDVTYAELAKMLVVLVKKDLTREMHDNAIWASSWMTWAAELGILEDVTIADSNAPATRADAFVMLYNALFSMKYIKRMPSNETMGILSQLKNNELTLNQGDKAKTFKFTNETVFVTYNYYDALDVNADKKNNNANYFAKAIKVSAISNPSYYYGSLIRVLTNDKNEITHILELGNPRDLALGHTYRTKWENLKLEDYVIDPNRRWAEIADATVETSTGKFVAENCCDKVDQKHGPIVAAKINYTDSHTAKSMDFIPGEFVKKPVNETHEYDPNNFVLKDYTFKPDTDASGSYDEGTVHVRLTKNTRYFVADVDRNQLTEVKDVEEAITILGLTRASNWFFDVYVGYDTVDSLNKIEHSKYPDVKGFNEATVVVFNSVLKGNNDDQLLRARQQSTNLYDVRLEDTDGKIVVENFASYRNGMQFVNASTEAGKAVEVSNLDVVEITKNNAYGVDALVKIDHSDRKHFPIVKVIDVDGRKLVVEGIDETASIILTTDYDQFLEREKLIGRYIQFHTLNANTLDRMDEKYKIHKDQIADYTNVIDIISILPENHDWVVQGSLRNVLHANEKAQHAGKVATIDFTQDASKHWQVIVHDYRNLYDVDQNITTEHYVISKTERDALYAYLAAHEFTTEGNREDIRFKVRRGVDGTLEMYDVEVYLNPEKQWTIVRRLYNEDFLTYEGYKYNKMLDTFNKLYAQSSDPDMLDLSNLDDIKALVDAYKDFKDVIPYDDHMNIVAPQLAHYAEVLEQKTQPRLEAQQEYQAYVEKVEKLDLDLTNLKDKTTKDNAVADITTQVSVGKPDAATVTVTLDPDADLAKDANVTAKIKIDYDKAGYQDSKEVEKTFTVPEA